MGQKRNEKVAYLAPLLCLAHVGHWLSTCGERWPHAHTYTHTHACTEAAASGRRGERREGQKGEDGCCGSAEMLARSDTTVDAWVGYGMLRRRWEEVRGW